MHSSVSKNKKAQGWGKGYAQAEKKLLAGAVAAFLMLLASCGGGGGTGGVTGSSTTLGGQAVLGPLSGSSIEISTLDGNLVASGTAQASASLTGAGSFSFTIPAANVANIYLVTARGGTDIDPTDSGTTGAGIASKGVLHAYVTDAQARAGNITLNPLTEIIYQDIALQYPNAVTALTSTEWTALLDAEAQKFLNAATSYADVLAFSPSANKANSKIVWSKVLAKLVKGIHGGDSSAAMMNRVQVLNASLLPAATTLSADGNTIERLEDISGDRVKTDIAKNAAGQVDVLEQKYVDASGAVVVVRATRMSATQSYLKVSISISVHKLGFEGSTTLLNGKVFSTANIAQFVSKLVSIAVLDATSLDITIDKSLSTRISANELVFTIDGREPDSAELNILLDDPKINWKWASADMFASQTIAFTVKNGSNNQMLMKDGTMILEVPFLYLDAHSGSSQDVSIAYKDNVKAVALDIANLVGAGALYGIYKGKNPIVAVKDVILSTPSDIYFLLNTAAPIFGEHIFTSTRMHLIGKLNNGEIIPGEKYTPMLFIRNKHADGTVLNISLSKNYVLQGLPVNGHMGPLYTQPRESMQIAKLTVKKNMGYIIIPSKQVAFFLSQAGKNLFPSGVPTVKVGAEITNKWEVVRYKKANISKTAQSFFVDFNYIVSGSNVSLDANATVSPDTTITSYTWKHNGVTISTAGPTATIAASAIDPNNNGLGSVTLNVTSVTGLTGSQTKTVTLNTVPWNTPKPTAPTGVTASAGNALNSISWSAVTGATSYNLYYGTTAGVTTSTGTKITGLTSPYSHTGLTNGTTYYYIVTAVNAGGEGSAGAEVSATPTAAPMASLSETFEGGSLPSTITVSTVGGFNFLPGIKNITALGSTKAFGFGRSTCGASCNSANSTSLTITFPSARFVTGISFKNMELYGDWGSVGAVFVNNVNIGLFRPTTNTNVADTIFRNYTLPINQTVTSIEIRVWDITTSSELFIDDLVVY